MHPHLHVLIVEDSEDDMLLMLRELRRGGYTLDAVRVETPEEMQAALDLQTWNVVIADYTLPEFSAPAALQLLQQQQRDIPFIIVSGTIGEETAVAAMKAGAHDYITKGNLARLVPAVERELREAEERQKRKVAERAFRESEERFRQLAENILESVFWMADPKTNQVLYISPAYEQIWGRSCHSLYRNSMEWLEAIHPEDQQRIQTNFFEQALIGGYDEEYRVIRPDGSVRWVRDRGFPIQDASGNPYRVVGIATDITEKKQLEVQFYRAQRLESMGTLASGIAHDLNNVLTPILAISQLLRLNHPDLDQRSQQMLQVLEESAQRGAKMIKQILTFTRGTSGERVPVQLAPLLQEVIDVVQQTFPKTIEIRQDFSGCSSNPDNPDQSLWWVSADSTCLHQVFMNLCVNARDAMPEGGILAFSIDHCFVDHAFAQTHLDAQVGNHVVVTIADTGTGIPLDVRDRIFDPFFTTKAPGQGTGLGLSTALGIVKNYDGFLQVVSELGQGTQVKVYLPTIEGISTHPAQLGQQFHGNGKLVLLVDDDDAVQCVTQTLLESHHCTVLATNDGMDAIELYTHHQDEIKVIILDIMMPNMSGTALIQRLKAINSKVKIIAISGLPANREPALAAGATVFLAKPYTLDNLLENLCRLIT
ncbi:hybrid sensor histidine kinase/response regulator [Egbenema bharatensis]|uniref:hybrid sensor histidine kinase/response regulator n=1 Tax=Egbenema bharatensis TaxID=3463334 RepID=UPI003A87EBD8